MTEPNYNWNEPECPAWVMWQGTDESGSVMQTKEKPVPNVTAHFWSTRGMCFVVRNPEQPHCPHWRETLRERPKVEAPIQLEVGKFGYRRRDGDIASNVQALSDGLFAVGGLTYRANGKHWCDNKDCQYNLISLIPDPDQPGEGWRWLDKTTNGGKGERVLMGDEVTYKDNPKGPFTPVEIGDYCCNEDVNRLGNTSCLFRRRITQPKEGGESCHPEATLEIDPAGSNAPVTSEPEAGANGPSTLQEMLEGLYQAATYHRKFDSANSAGILDASLKLAERFRVKPEPRKEGDALSSVNAPVAVDITQSEHHVLEAEPNAAPKVPPSGAAESENIPCHICGSVTAIHGKYCSAVGVTPAFELEEKVREFWITVDQGLGKVFGVELKEEAIHVHDATACDRKREAMEKELADAKGMMQAAGVGDYKGDYFLGELTITGALRSEVEKLREDKADCIKAGYVDCAKAIELANIFPLKKVQILQEFETRLRAAIDVAKGEIK